MFRQNQRRFGGDNRWIRAVAKVSNLRYREYVLSPRAFERRDDKYLPIDTLTENGRARYPTIIFCRVCAAMLREE